MSRMVKLVRVGDITLGDGNIYIQSMLNCPANDISANVTQAKALEEAGCDIIRAAIPDMKAIALIPAIKEAVKMPLVADIHFDYKLALEAIEAGVDKIRINPGNIGDKEKVAKVATACEAKGVPIRIGVNSGSLERDLLKKYGSPTAMALVESAMRHVKMLEDNDFHEIVISIKSSNVDTMINSYRLLSQECQYPLHLGVTEAGTERIGTIKSAIGIGSLLHDGIGETIRVSLTADPLREIVAAKDILRAMGRKGGLKIISCPTCGRTKIDLIELTYKLEKALEGIEKDITVAVMGCVVNGPGEAREADIGIAGGDGCAVLFKKGEVVRKINEDNIVDELLSEIKSL